MTDAIEALVEIFTWVGLGSGLFVAAIALILYLADGTWMPVRAMIDAAGDHRVARWFSDDGGVGQAPLSEAQDAEIGPSDAADVWVRQGSSDRMRLTRRSPLVRAAALLAAGLLGLGLVASIISLVMLFTAG